MKPLLEKEIKVRADIPQVETPTGHPTETNKLEPTTLRKNRSVADSIKQIQQNQLRKSEEILSQKTPTTDRDDLWGYTDNKGNRYSYNQVANAYQNINSQFAEIENDIKRNQSLFNNGKINESTFKNRVAKSYEKYQNIQNEALIYTNLDTSKGQWFDFKSQIDENNTKIGELSRQLTALSMAKSNDVNAFNNIQQEMARLKEENDQLQNFYKDQQIYSQKDEFMRLKQEGNWEDLLEFSKLINAENLNYIERLGYVGLSGLISVINGVFNTIDVAKEIYDTYFDGNDIDNFDPNDVDLISNKLKEAQMLYNSYAVAGKDGFYRWSLESINSLTPFIINTMIAKGLFGLTGTPITATPLQHTTIGMGFMQGASDTTKENLRNGYDLETSLLHGALMGGVETLSELIGGEGLTRALIGDVGQYFAGATLKKMTAKEMARIILETGTAEGLEEVFSAYGSEIATNFVNMIMGTDIDSGDTSFDSLLNQFASAFFGTALLGAGSSINVTIQNNRQYAGAMELRNEVEKMKTNALVLLQNEVNNLNVEALNHTIEQADTCLRMIDQVVEEYKSSSALANSVVPLRTDIEIPTFEEAKSVIMQGMKPDMDVALAATEKMAINEAKVQGLHMSLLERAGIHLHNGVHGFWDLSDIDRANLVEVAKRTSQLSDNFNDKVIYTNNLADIVVAFPNKLVRLSPDGNGVYIPHIDKYFIATQNPFQALEKTITHEFTHGAMGTKEYAVLEQMAQDFYVEKNQDKVNEYVKKGMSQQEAKTQVIQDKKNQLSHTYREQLQGLTKEGRAILLQDEFVAHTLQEELGSIKMLDKLVKYDTSKASRIFENLSSRFKGDTLTKLKTQWLKAVSKEQKSKMAKVEANYSISDKTSVGTELTKEQKDFFDKAKTTDNNNQLMELYHGTPLHFDVFKPIKYGGQHGNYYGFGIYLTSDKTLANKFGNNVMTMYANITNPVYDNKVTFNVEEVAKMLKLTNEQDLEIAKQLSEEIGETFNQEEYLKDTIADFITLYNVTTNQSVDDIYLNIADGIIKQYDNDFDIMSTLMNRLEIDSYWDAYDFYENILVKATGKDGIIHTNEGTKKAPVYMPFYSEQLKDPRNLTPTKQPNIHYSISEHDNQGRLLTSDQRDFYNDNKAVDKYGRLLTLYHGTDGDFTVFDPVKFGRDIKQEGYGIYLTDSKYVAEQYGKNVMEVYALIKKPLSAEEKTITKNEAFEIVSKIAHYEADKIMVDEGLSKQEALLNTFISNFSDSNIIYDVMQKTINELYNNNENDSDFIAEILNVMGVRDYEGAYKVYDILNREFGYDGIIAYWYNEDRTDRNTIVIPFYSSQIKSVDNLSPTLDPDIYYSMGGYDGYSMSNRARQAYEEGKKPLSKFNKDDLAYFNSELASREIDAQVTSIRALKDIVKDYGNDGEWHHTGKFYNATDFYNIDLALDNVSADIINEYNKPASKERMIELVNKAVENGDEFVKANENEIKQKGIRNDRFVGVDVIPYFQYDLLVEKKYRNNVRFVYDKATNSYNTYIGDNLATQNEINDLLQIKEQQEVYKNNESELTNAYQSTIYERSDKGFKEFFPNYLSGEFEKVGKQRAIYPVGKSGYDKYGYKTDVEYQDGDRRYIEVEDLEYKTQERKEGKWQWVDDNIRYSLPKKSIQEQYSQYYEQFDEMVDTIKEIYLDKPSKETNKPISRFDKGDLDLFNQHLKDKGIKVEVESIRALRELAKRYATPEIVYTGTENRRTRFYDFEQLASKMTEQIINNYNLSYSERHHLKGMEKQMVKNFEQLLQELDRYDKDWADMIRSYQQYANETQRWDIQKIVANTLAVMKANKNTNFDNVFHQQWVASQINKESAEYRMASAEQMDLLSQYIVEEANNKSQWLSWKTLEQVGDELFRGKKELRQEWTNALEKTKAVSQEKENNYLKRAQEVIDMVRDLGIIEGSKEAKAVQFFQEKHTNEILLEDGKPKLNENGKPQWKPYTMTDLKNEFSYKMKNGKYAYENIIEAAKIISQEYSNLFADINYSQMMIYGDVNAQTEVNMAKAKSKIILSMETVNNLNEKLQKETDTETKNNIALAIKQETDKLNKYINSYNNLEKKYDKGDLNRRQFTPFRENYAHHIKKKTLASAIKGIVNGTYQVPTELAGLTSRTKPSSRWAKFMAQQGFGDYHPDAITSYLAYVSSASKVIAYNPLILNVRMLRNGLTNWDVDNKHNEIAKWLDYYGNDIAGKRNDGDRWWHDQFLSTKLGKLLYEINMATKRAIFKFNIRTSLMQLGSIPDGLQMLQRKGKGDTYKDVINGMTHWIGDLSNKDARWKQSTFLSNRFMDVKTYKKGIDTTLDSISDYMMVVFDKMSTQLMWNSAYEQAERLGIEDKIFYADDLTRRAVAGRGVGELPPVMRSKLLDMITPFQVEINNKWQNSWNDGKDGRLDTLIILQMATFLLNQVIRSMGLKDDPFPTLLTPIYNEFKKHIDTYGWNGENLEEMFMAMGWGMIGETIGALPMGDMILPLTFGEEGADKIFGDYNPNPYGAQNLVFGGFGTLITDFADGDYEKLAKDIIKNYMAGGTQIVRTAEGLQSMGALPKRVKEEEGYRIETSPIDYTKSGNVRYINDTDDLMNWWSAIAFGKWNTKQAQEYVESGFKRPTQKEMNFFDLLLNSYENEYEAMKKAQQLNEIEPDKNHLGKTIDNSRAFKTKKELQKMGLYDEVLEKIETGKAEPKDFNLNKSMLYDSAYEYIMSKPKPKTESKPESKTKPKKYKSYLRSQRAIEKHLATTMAKASKGEIYTYLTNLLKKNRNSTEQVKKNILAIRKKYESRL